MFISHAGHNHAQSKLNDNLIDRSTKVDGVKAINKIRQNSKTRRHKKCEWVETDCLELSLQLIFPQKKGGHFWGGSGALKHLTNNLTSNKPTRCSGSRVGGFGVKGCSGGQWSAHQRPV